MGRTCPPRAGFSRLIRPTMLYCGLFCGLLCGVLALGSPVLAAPPGGGMRAPSVRSGPRPPLQLPPHPGWGGVLRSPVKGGQRPLALGLLAAYRLGVSPFNGHNSDVAPVHSLYAVQAVKRHGALLGLLLTAERLLHEPDELRRTPRITEGGRVFHLDPLTANTYWLPDWLQ